MRAKAVAAFIDHCIKKDAPDAYEVFRLVLPQTDRRGFPGVSPHRLIYLVTIAVKQLVCRHPHLAAAVAHDGGRDLSSRLFRWQDQDDLALALGESSELSEILREKVFDVFCGDFSESDAERHGVLPTQSLTVEEVNWKLNELSEASCGNCVEQQTDIVAWFMQRLTSREMMWWTRIVLKRTRIWIKERDVLEQAPWGDEAVKRFIEQGKSFESLLENVLEDVPEVRPGVPQGEPEVVGEREKNTMYPTHVTRLARIVMGSIEDACMYMGRRFKPGNYEPMTFIVDAAFDGIKVRIRRDRGETRIEYSEDEKKRVGLECEGTALLDAAARMAGRDAGIDFEIEADVLAWNVKKGCAEPRFILESLMELDRRLQEVSIVSCDSQLAYSAQREHLEILVLITDVISYHGECRIKDFLHVRQESLACFESTRWGAEDGLRTPVRVLPLVPGATQLGRVSISEVLDNTGSIHAFRDSVKQLGSTGVALRAPEAEWNTAEKVARIMVMNNMGVSIIDCAVMGYWRNIQNGVEGRVSHWLLGVVHDGSGPNADGHCGHSVYEPILKLRNCLHIVDEQAALARIESDVPVHVDRSTGMYSCDPAALQTRDMATVLSVAGSLQPPGRWSASPLVLMPTILGLSQPGSAVTSVIGMCEMIKAKRLQIRREKVPSVRFRDKKVAERFLPSRKGGQLPCAPVVPSSGGLLKDFNVYFVNHTTGRAVAVARYQAKRRCEALVEALGGVVMQSYNPNVNLVVAGHPTFITNAFRKKNIDILTVEWLEKMASLSPQPERVPPIRACDYLREWNPGDSREKNAQKSVLDLFMHTNDGPGGVSPKIKRPKVAQDHFDTVPDSPRAIQQENMTAQTIQPAPIVATPSLPQNPTDGKQNEIETGQNTMQATVTGSVGIGSLPGDTSHRLALGATVERGPSRSGSTPPTKNKAMSLKERAAAIGTPASSSRTSTQTEPASERQKPKLSLRDRAKRLGLSKK